MRAIMFGSIGVLAETSDMQRLGFNDAFREAGLDWSWSPQDYRAMLRQSGGQDRIARYAAARGVSVDAPALHAAKTRHFLARLAGGVPL
ncbi:MAG: haloacid dehalogenase, partial [Gemmobacter sp.]